MPNTQKDLQKEFDQRLGDFIHQDFNSTPYLIMTIFGDSVIPHGGEIWLGSLVKLLAPLNISERLVRTSIFRLTRDGWLVGNKVGRKSYYRATTHEEISDNEQKIYYQQEKWDGHWRLVVGMSMEKNNLRRDDFRKQLLRLGFLAISPNIFGHPTLSYSAINQLVAEFEMEHSYLVIQAKNYDGESLTVDQFEGVLQRSVIQPLSEEYQKYLARYQIFADDIDQLSTLNNEQCFLLNSLMINDYRRILWHDLIRSNLLLDEKWIGRDGRKMTARIYCAVEEQSRQHFRKISEDENGSIGVIDLHFKKRFKHLI